VPGTSHTIAARPSNLVAKVDTIMAWFEKYDPPKVSRAGEADD
jgi:acylaminoacyl-peptidase